MSEFFTKLHKEINKMFAKMNLSQVNLAFYTPFVAYYMYIVVCLYTQKKKFSQYRHYVQ